MPSKQCELKKKINALKIPLRRATTNIFLHKFMWHCQNIESHCMMLIHHCHTSKYLCMISAHCGQQYAKLGDFWVIFTWFCIKFSMIVENFLTLFRIFHAIRRTRPIIRWNLYLLQHCCTTTTCSLCKYLAKVVQCRTILMTWYQLTSARCHAYFWGISCRYCVNILLHSFCSSMIFLWHCAMLVWIHPMLISVMKFCNEFVWKWFGQHRIQMGPRLDASVSLCNPMDCRWLSRHLLWQNCIFPSPEDL